MGRKISGIPIYGIGINDGKYPSWENNASTKCYEVWVKMLCRCVKKDKKHIAYHTATCSDNFKNYSYFYEWCQTQVGFNQEDFHLDKDVLVKGNKVYSEDTCVFIPRELNLLLTKCDRSRGIYPVGVTLRKGRFRARLSINHKEVSAGYFDNAEEAFYAYKAAKESHIRVTTEKYKEVIDPRAYQALMQYTVEITD